MKEINDIIKSYEKAVEQGKSCALATVVHVQGSSYRRPGARMLVTDDGMLTGAISGGCLEGDALRKALLAIHEGKNKLVTYDTTDEDDAKFGVQLGCNGIVHILFEPIDHTAKNHPLVLLKKVMEKRRDAVIVTLFSLKHKQTQPGTRFLYTGTESERIILNLNNEMNLLITQDAAEILGSGKSEMIRYEDAGLYGFFQLIPPPISLIIGGAGNDAVPMVAIANLLGWQVTLIDGRNSHATKERFPSVENLIVSPAEGFLDQLVTDRNTVCILMTHNYNYDLAVFRQLLHTNMPYIGLLGPRSKMDRMYNDLSADGIFVEDRENIYTPIGLDIGAETSEEIALSVAAEIKAVMMNKNAHMLRDKEISIHS